MLNDVRCYLVDNILALTDKATMAASIEGRVPLLDHRLVEFAFSLVPSINYGDRQPKRLFKQVLAGHLPADLLNRPKEGFNPPMKQWLIGERGGDMEIELCEQLVEPLSEMFEPLMIQKTLTDQKKRGLASESLYTLYLFNRWWRTHYK